MSIPTNQGEKVLSEPLRHNSPNQLPQSQSTVSSGPGDGHGDTVGANDDKGSQALAEQTNLRKQFEVTWDGEDDPINPRTMSKARKWLIVMIVATSSTCVCGFQIWHEQSIFLTRASRTCASSLYTSTYAQLTVELHCSRMVATLGLSLFVVGLGLGPMLLGPLSEVQSKPL